MGDLAHQLAGDVAWQLRVRIEREHVLDRGEQLAGSGDDDERCLLIAEQQSIQLLQLATLALPPHEAAFLGVVLAPAMQQPEARAGAAMPLVQDLDAAPGELQQLGVALQRLARGVGMVGEQREVQIGIRVGERSHLQVQQQLFDGLRAVDQHRDGHQRAKLVGDALVQTEPGEQPRRTDRHHQAAGEPKRDLARRKREQEQKQRQAPVAWQRALPDSCGSHQQGEAEERQGSHVEQGGPGEDRAYDAAAQARAIAHLPFELGTAIVGQIIADVRAHAVFGVGLLRGFAQLERSGGDSDLVRVAAPGKRLDGVAIAVARGLVAGHVGARRITAQHGLHLARALEKRIPVERGHGAHARDRVADRDLIRCLAQVLAPGELFGGGGHRGAALGDPVAGAFQRSVVLAQAVQQLHQKGRADRLRALLQLPQLRARLQRRGARLQQTLGPDVAAGAILRGGFRGGERAHAQAQTQPQHDGHGPQLTDRERRDALIGDHEIAEGLKIDAPVAVPKIVDAQGVDARIAAHRTLAEARQLQQIAERQVLRDLAQLVFDDVRVVQQPLFRGRRLAVMARFGCQDAIGLVNALAGAREARAQRARRQRRPRRSMGLGQLLRVGDQVFFGVELTAQMLRFVPSQVGVQPRASWSGLGSRRAFCALAHGRTPDARVSVSRKSIRCNP
jgi:hypothetical protein